MLIPIARAVVSAKLPFEPRTIPMLASRAASNGAADPCCAVAGFGISFSIRSSRRLIVASIFSRFHDGIDDLMWDAADGARVCSGEQLIDLPHPVVEPCFGIGYKAADIRQSRFEFWSRLRRFAIRPHFRVCFEASVASSSSDKRASISSISIALAAWFKMLSAALTLVEGGVF